MRRNILEIKLDRNRDNYLKFIIDLENYLISRSFSTEFLDKNIESISKLNCLFFCITKFEWL